LCLSTYKARWLCLTTTTTWVGHTENDKVSGKLGGRATRRQLVTAVAASILQSDARDGQLTASICVVSYDVMPLRELCPWSQPSVDDLGLVAPRRVVVPAKRRCVAPTL